ncbi:MAG TPA: tetratricopeptide repeat protein [Nitrospirae bacterium]|nr:tetratricopeptide repeat protein [Nitrospirota bacterium]
MGKLITLIFILFLGLIAYFAVLNRETVTVLVTNNLAYEIPKIALVLISATAGALLMLIIYTIRDTRRLIDNIQAQKRQKKQEKVQALYSRSLGAIYAGKTEVATDALKDILKEDPMNVQALLRLGELALKEKDNKQALDYFKRALSSDPENVETLLSLVKVKELMDEHEEALTYIDEILENDPQNITALYRKREILERLARWDDLIYLQKGIIKQSNDENEQQMLVGYKYEYGRESLEAGELEKAKKAFRNVIKLDKDFIPAHLGLAEVMVQEENTEEAINYLEKTYRQYKFMIVLARLEDLLLNIGEPSRLIRLYKDSLAEKPSDNVLKFFLAKLYYRLEMLDDALEIIQGIENPAAFPEIAKIKGGIYLKRGQAEKAVEEFGSALNLKMTLRIPYCCLKCGHTFEQWTGRCSSCGRWNTYYFNIHKTCRATDAERE